MIPLVLLGMFGASCLWLIVDGLKRRGGIYEFSFLAGAGLFGLLFAQAVGIVRNPGMAPEAGVCKALIMATLCAGAIYLGWNAPVRTPRVDTFRLPFSLKWLYRIGIACSILGLYGTVKMAGLYGGVPGLTVSVGHHDNLVWHGLPVMYTFFQWYSYLGLVLVASVALRLRSWLLAIPAAVPFTISLGDVVLSGRRSESVMLVLILGCVLFFGAKVAPPRAMALAMVPFAMLAMFLAPAYRSRTQSGRWGEIRQISTSETMQNVFSGTEGEFWSMSYAMEVTDSENMYQYGVGFYNTFVAYYVPTLIIGKENKQKLFVDVPTAGYTANRFGWVIPFGMVPTGPFSVFAQFWYFGAICFYFLAKWLKGHWVRALAGDFWSQVVYAVAVTFAVSAVTNDFFSIYNALFVFILPVKLLTGMLGSMREMAQTYSFTAPANPRTGAHPQAPA